MTRPYVKGSEAERFWPKVDRSDGCWLWTAATNEHGYGIFRRTDGTNIRAHRWSWMDVNGPIPDGQELDHVVCRNRACVRPSHIEAVTHAVNIERAVPGRRVWRRERTHCKHGHAFTPENTRIYRGQRLCITCVRDTDRRTREKRRGV